jgi:transcriptional regulator with XRE-family HTH domain
MTNKIIQVEKTIQKLGYQLQVARKRRKISTETMALRIGVTRVTLARMERGESSVSIEVYMNAIYMLDGNKLNAVANLFDSDHIAQLLTEKELPQRIRNKKRLVG